MCSLGAGADSGSGAAADPGGAAGSGAQMVDDMMAKTGPMTGAMNMNRPLDMKEDRLEAWEEPLEEMCLRVLASDRVWLQLASGFMTLAEGRLQRLLQANPVRYQEFRDLCRASKPSLTDTRGPLAHVSAHAAAANGSQILASGGAAALNGSPVVLPLQPRIGGGVAWPHTPSLRACLEAVGWVWKPTMVCTCLVVPNKRYPDCCAHA
jgi:hypothetical protein